MHMQSKLYHREVFAPSALFKSPGILSLRYTEHARLAAKNDRYGDLSQYLRPDVQFDAADIVEIEVQGGLIAKWVVRLSVTRQLDLVMAITREGAVKTVWGNKADDSHASLDIRKYVRRPNTLPVFK